jgi:hypothetical protein
MPHHYQKWVNETISWCNKCGRETRHRALTVGWRTVWNTNRKNRRRSKDIRETRERTPGAQTVLIGDTSIRSRYARLGGQEIAKTHPEFKGEFPVDDPYLLHDIVVQNCYRYTLRVAIS